MPLFQSNIKKMYHHEFNWILYDWIYRNLKHCPMSTIPLNKNQLRWIRHYFLTYERRRPSIFIVLSFPTSCFALVEACNTSCWSAFRSLIRVTKVWPVSRCDVGLVVVVLLTAKERSETGVCVCWEGGGCSGDTGWRLSANCTAHRVVCAR